MTAILGFFVLVDALDDEEQWALAVKCLTVYSRPPNRTNLDLHLGPVGDRIAAHFLGIPASAGAAPPTAAAAVPSASELGSKLRWTTLGFQYDWTRRSYSRQEHVAFPPDLAALTRRLGQAAGCSFTAEAAIINYYALGSRNDDAPVPPSLDPADSTLGGHLDDAETYFDAPIVSIRSDESICRDRKSLS